MCLIQVLKYLRQFTIKNINKGDYYDLSKIEITVRKVNTRRTELH